MARTVKATARDLQTFRANTKQDASGCLLWTGPTDSSGYGVISTSSGQHKVHRWSWMVHRGPIDDGLQVDHACHTAAVAAGTCSADQERCQHRRCCAPGHLELVTNAENTRRQDHANRRKTTCPAGHDLTDPTNVRVRPSGRRACRACDRARKRAEPASAAKP